MHAVRTTLDTPLGSYVLVASAEGVTHFQPEGSPKLPPGPASGGPAAQGMLEAARAAFEAYFAGACDALAALTLAPEGTPFRRLAWRALCGIAPGDTASYGEIARRIASPSAARAVGSANHHNPIAIAIPCHRVIGGDGRLVGYAGGVDRKRWLLAHEGAWASARGYAASSKSKVPSARRESADVRSRASAAASI
jgi:methylated-DNA-[protein]-cysteine S-methyltransferase